MQLQYSFTDQASFVAQYWGQDVAIYDGYRYGTQYVDGDILREEHVEKTCLLLKPVSLLSQEDAIEIIKIKHAHDAGDISLLLGFKIAIATKSSEINSASIECIVSHAKWDDFVIREFISPSTRSNYAVIDFLRSKGYAVTWKTVTVEEQIKRGWVKLVSYGV